MEQPAFANLADRTARVEHIRAMANWVRRRLLRMIYTAGQGHPGGDLSATDILTTLYFGVMRYDPSRPDDLQRDRFIMSKGHATGALYAVLGKAGFFPESELDTYLQPESRLNGHPNRTYLPGVETNTGPLGHGFPVGVGVAIAGELDRADYHTYVLTGDGELQEGSMWEAAMCAGHRRLNNLTVIVDRNGLQQGARTEDTNALEPLADKWRAFGWEVMECDGHDVDALLSILEQPRSSRTRPLCIIAKTFKGNGVSYMQDQAGWHHGVPTAEQLALAMQELGGELGQETGEEPNQ
jgi:transketolase